MEHGQAPLAPTKGSDHADDLMVYASKRKILGATLAGAALTAMGVVALALGPTDLSSHPFLTRVAGVIAVSLFSVATLWMFLSLFSAVPRVTVSHQGIWVNSPLLSRTDPIPWAEIEGLRLAVRAGAYSKRVYLLIQLRNRQAIRARQTRRQAVLWRLTGYSLVWPQAVPVFDVMLPMSAAELLGRIRARFEHELALYGVQVQGV